MKHNFKKLTVFVKNISIFNPMVLVSTDDNCTDYGVHFPKPIFEYLHCFLRNNLEFQSLILNLSKIHAILVIHVQVDCYAFLSFIFMLMACILHQVSITVKKGLKLHLSQVDCEHTRLGYIKLTQGQSSKYIQPSNFKNHLL